MMHELQPGDPQLIGPYRLHGRLGAGGMGQVFLGRSAGGRPVAVKVVRPHLATDPEFRERFRREIAVARKVSGVYTSPVIDADVDGPLPWLATAYVEGPSLADAVSQHGPLPPRSVLAVAKGLAEGLGAIHARGVDRIQPLRQPRGQRQDRTRRQRPVLPHRLRQRRTFDISGR